MGYHDFAFKIFCLRVPKIFVGEHFGVSENFGYRKILHIREGGGITFLRWKLLSHSTEKFSWGTFRCIRKFRVWKNFMHQRGGRVSRFSVENFLSHKADKNRRRTLLCFERILVSKIFKQRRGEASRFCRKFFYLTGPKKLRQGTILCFRKFLVGKKFTDKKRVGGGRYHDFPSKSFCLTVPKYFIGDHFGVSEKLFLSKIFKHRRVASRFCRNFLSHRTETESFVKEPFCFPEKFWYRKKIIDKSGHITIFSQNFYVPQCRKIS